MPFPDGSVDTTNNSSHHRTKRTFVGIPSDRTQKTSTPFPSGGHDKGMVKGDKSNIKDTQSSSLSKPPLKSSSSTLKVAPVYYKELSSLSDTLPDSDDGSTSISRTAKQNRLLQHFGLPPFDNKTKEDTGNP